MPAGARTQGGSNKDAPSSEAPKQQQQPGMSTARRTDALSGFGTTAPQHHKANNTAHSFHGSLEALPSESSRVESSLKCLAWPAAWILVLFGFGSCPGNYVVQCSTQKGEDI
ncbi:hypothetical protein ACLKA7_004118 [Drosophila subpalustris]